MQESVRRISSRGLHSGNSMLGYLRQKDPLASVPGSNYGPSGYQSSQHSSKKADEENQAPDVQHIVASQRAVIADIPTNTEEKNLRFKWSNMDSKRDFPLVQLENKILNYYASKKEIIRRK